jgi:hypothetical protein
MGGKKDQHKMGGGQHIKRPKQEGKRPTNQQANTTAALLLLGNKRRRAADGEEKKRRVAGCRHSGTNKRRRANEGMLGRGQGGGGGEEADGQQQLCCCALCPARLERACGGERMQASRVCEREWGMVLVLSCLCTHHIEPKAIGCWLKLGASQILRIHSLTEGRP